MAKLVDRYKRKIDRVRGQISTADARVRELEGAASAKKQEEVMSGAGDLLGAFLGGSRSSNPLGRAASRRAATRTAEARADAAAEKFSAKQMDLADLEDELSDEMVEITDERAEMVDAVETLEIGLEKTDVRVAAVGCRWATTTTRPYRPALSEDLASRPPPVKSRPHRRLVDVDSQTRLSRRLHPIHRDQGRRCRGHDS